MPLRLFKHFSRREKQTTFVAIGRLRVKLFISDYTIANGLLRVVTTLNYEETKSQLITVDAFDGNHTNSTTVKINILPVNEYDPVFKSNSTVWNVTENSKAQHLCVNVSLTFLLHSN